MTNEFKKSEKIVLAVIFVCMSILAVSILFPMLWAVSSSLKGELDYYFNVLGFPKVVVFDNFINIFSLLKVKVLKDTGVVEVGFLGMLINSIMYSGFESLMAVIMPSLVAYATAKYNFPGKKIILTINIFVMIVPIIGSLPAKLTFLKQLGIYDNMFLYVITQTGSFGFNFLLLQGMFAGLSWTYSEAAFIDGANHFQVMIKIMFPMMLPTMTVIFVRAFIASWNTYTPMLIYLPSYPNLFLGMYYFQNMASINYATTPQILAGLLIVAVPSALLYLLSQRILLSNFVIGGIKG